MADFSQPSALPHESAAVPAPLAPQSSSVGIGASEPPDLQGSENLSNKRKRGEDGAQQRSKRNRYISIACNECKRRKIKCNGEHPCQRCGNLQLECVYAPNCCTTNFKESPEYKSMSSQVVSLQEQVNMLWQSLNTLRNALGHEVMSQPEPFSVTTEGSRQVAPAQANMIIDPALNRNHNGSQHGKYQGPTSAQYNFDLARSSLQSLGIGTGDDTFDSRPQISQAEAVSSTQQHPTFQLHPSIAPFREISKDEALRLCNVYAEEMGLMYPILDIGRISQYATLVFTLGDAVERNASISLTPETGDPAVDADMEILKLVLANALVVETAGKSTLASRLFTSCSKRTDASLTEDVTLKNIQLMTLISMYLFHSDQETRAWRTIGVAARLCIELGLHRSETYVTLFSSDDERDAALRLFWSVYTLDKRWSLGTGMASALIDSDIDLKLEKPHSSSPYLACMVDYSKIASKVYHAFGSRDANDGMFDRNQAEYLDYQVLQWYKNIPNFLKFPGPKLADYAEPQQQDSLSRDSRPLYRLQVILYLRANHMRIQIDRPVLHSAQRILSNDFSPFARKAVEIAKDSIRTLSRISQASDIYHTQQMSFNHFLLTALGVLFLAVAHAPTQYAAPSRDEFYIALELVRGLSSQSPVSERLWRTVKGLLEIGPKLGLHPRQAETEKSTGSPNVGRSLLQVSEPMQDHQAASSAAMAMAGLRAGRPMDETDLYAAASHTPSRNNRALGYEARNDSLYPTSPNGMANDLLSLFEAAGSYATAESASEGITYSDQGRAQAPPGPMPGGAAVGMAGGHEDDLGRIMRDLF
ncbi:MAG: hypothetical protein Q9162_004751 [Coniocarpon cinnabarinum]